MDKALYKRAIELGYSKQYLEELFSFEPYLNVNQIEEYSEGLRTDQFQYYSDKLKEELKGKENGLLNCSYIIFLASLKAYEIFKEKNIPENIIKATFAEIIDYLESDSIKSFYNEEHADFWIGRHLSFHLFRIGIFGCEFEVYDGKPEVGLHIPVKANLNKENIDNSLKEMIRFLHRFFPNFGECPVYCMSWLMSPSLNLLLPKESNIINFQSYFELINCYDDMHVMSWVYGEDTKDLQHLPEDTTLRKNLKKYLMDGNEYKGALCKLKESEYLRLSK